MSALGPLAQANNDTPTYQFNLAPQPLGDALKSVGQQAATNVLFDPGVVENKTAPALHGMLTTRQAIDQLLGGTELIARQTSTDTVLVQSKQALVRSAGQVSQHQESGKEGKSGSSGEFRVAQVDPAAAGGAAALAQSANSPAAADRSAVEEIVVTAQKRVERLQDVPVPVTAISADTLVDTNQVSIADYYARIPGLSLTPTGFGGPQVTIRGVTTGGFANPTVGVVVDDVPYGSSTNIGGLGSIVPDIDPSDLARVEVLRGPQGTLYGASAMGGLLKFVTVDPSTDGLSGHVQAGVSATHNGDIPGYSARGTINVPVNDSIAVLASGFARRDPGYIDNVQTGQTSVNTLRVQGGRLSGLWRPTESFSVKLSAMLQNSKSDGSDDIDPTLGDLKQSKLIGSGGYNKRAQVYSATIAAKLAGMDLISLSGYNINDFHFSSDYSPFYSGFAQSSFGVGGTPIFERNKTDKFTQEIRLSSSIGQRLDWLVGLYYTNERSTAIQRLYASDITTGMPVGSLYFSDIPSDLAEYAAFGDVTVHFTDQFDIQLGARESHIRQHQSGISNGALVGGESDTPEVSTTANAFTYLVTPRYRLSPDLMLYARLASGYRAGGPNPNITLFGLPQSFAPDKTLNYEVGLKGHTPDRVLAFDASVYYIDWKDIQLQVLNNGFLYYTNGSRAKSEGVELSAEARPVHGLTLAGWIAWNEAVLRDPLPPGSALVGAYGAAGDRLPDSSRLTGSLSADEELTITNLVRGFVGASVSYQSNRLGNFAAAPPVGHRVIYPAFARTDLHAGIKYDTWTLSLFANNVTDRRGVLTSDVVPTYFLYVQPRTIGLNISRVF